MPASPPIILLPAPTDPAMTPVPAGTGWSHGIFASLARDGDAALTLLDRQLSLPLRPGETVAMIASLVAGLLIAIVVPLVAARGAAWLVRRRAGAGRLAPLAEAVATVFVTCAAVGFGAMTMASAVETGLYLLPITRALIQTAVAGAFVAGLGIGVGMAIAAVEDPDHRPFRVSAPDWVYRFYAAAWGTMLALSGLVEQTARLLHAAAPSRTLAHGLVLLIELALLVGFLVHVGRSRDAAANEGTKPNSTSMAMTAVSWTAITLGVVAFMLGYLSFAVLLFQELMWAALVAAVAIMSCALVEEALDYGLGSEHVASRFATHIVGIRPERMTQAALLATAIATVLIWLVAISLMLAPLGGHGVVLVDQVRGRLIVGELRHLHIAPVAIATGIGTLAVGVILTRILRRWLESRFLPATHLDIGARASIVTGVSYAAILLVLVAALNAAGIDLAKVTLIASALSVGIGFGLQSIIQNFVSGVILLGERPIKVGDWVSASGSEGSVRRIRVRATELATADGSVAIVPNSLFISGAVINRTGAGIAGRIEVMVRIGGLDTAAEARDTVLALVAATDGLMASPPPQLLLTDMTADGFGFTLQVYADRRRPVAEVRSRLLYALVDGLSNELKVTIA